MPSQIQTFLASALCGLSLTAGAIDLGVQGSTWDIGEEDLRRLLMRQADSVTEEQWNAQQAQIGKNFLTNLPVFNLPPAKADQLMAMDMSVTLQNDMVLPYFNEEKDEYEWRTYFKAGTKVNPLDNPAHRPRQALFFFDPTDEEQLKVAKELLAQHKMEMLFVLTKGGTMLKDLMDETKINLFYASQLELEKFQVRTTPTMIFWREDKYPGYLLNYTFKKPYDANRIYYEWKPTASPFVKETTQTSVTPAAPKPTNGSKSGLKSGSK